MAYRPVSPAYFFVFCFFYSSVDVLFSGCDTVFKALFVNNLSTYGTGQAAACTVYFLGWYSLIFNQDFFITEHEKVVALLVVCTVPPFDEDIVHPHVPY